MKLIIDVLQGLVDMFIGDKTISLAVLLLVAAASALSWWGVGGPAAVGAVLVLGAPAALLGAVWGARPRA